jgi:hypothetical protein
MMVDVDVDEKKEDGKMVRMVVRGDEDGGREARTVALFYGLFGDGSEGVNPGLTLLGLEKGVALGDGDQCPC